MNLLITLWEFHWNPSTSAWHIELTDRQRDIHTYTGNYMLTHTLWQDGKANMVRAAQSCQVHFPGKTHTRTSFHTDTNCARKQDTAPSDCFPESNNKTAVYLIAVTEESWWRDGPIAAWDHDTDPSLNKWDREIDDLRTLLVDRQGSHCHDGFLINHLFQRCQRWMIAGVEEEWRVVIRKPGRKIEKKKKRIV